MTRQSISWFTIFSLLLISVNQNVNAQIPIDLYGRTIIREVNHTFLILTCGTNQTFNHFVFQCIPSESFEIIEQSCVVEQFTCFDPNFIGLSCNISNDACEMAEQCSNNGICYSNNSLPSKFQCDCLSGYDGYDCSDDIRICKNNTCWHDGECIVMDASLSYKDEASYDCQCEPGYQGAHCEHITNMCENITCQNNGKCVYSHLSWKCQCLGHSYSGMYCEQKSTSLKVRQIISKSVAYIAILAICGVVLFVIIMDVLKYIFKIDPVGPYRQLKKSNIAKQRKKPKKISFKLPCMN